MTINDKRTFVGLRLSCLFFYCGIGIVTPFMSLYYYLAGLNLTQIGILGSTSAVCSMVATPLGNLSDRLRVTKIFMIVGMCALALLYPLYTFTQDFSLFILLVTLTAVSAAAYATISSALVTNVSKLTETGRKFGAYRMSGSIGWIVASILGGVVADSFGMATAFFVCSALLMAGAVSIYRLVSEPKIDLTPAHIHLSEYSRDKNLASFLLVTAITGVSKMMVHEIFPIYLSNLGATKTIIGAAAAIAGISEIPGLVYLGSLSDRIGRKPVLTMVFFAYPLRWFLYTVINEPLLVLPVELLHMFTFGAYLSVSTAYISDITSSQERGTAMGLFNTSSSLGAVVGPVIGGIIADKFGIITMFRVSSAIALASALIFYFQRKA